MSDLLLLGISMVGWRKHVEFPLEGKLTTLFSQYLLMHLCLPTKRCEVMLYSSLYFQCKHRVYPIVEIQKLFLSE